MRRNISWKKVDSVSPISFKKIARVECAQNYPEKLRQNFPPYFWKMQKSPDSNAQKIFLEKLDSISPILLTKKSPGSSAHKTTLKKSHFPLNTNRNEKSPGSNPHKNFHRKIAEHCPQINTERRAVTRSNALGNCLRKSGSISPAFKLNNWEFSRVERPQNVSCEKSDSIFPPPASNGQEMSNPAKISWKKQTAFPLSLQRKTLQGWTPREVTGSRTDVFLQCNTNTLKNSWLDTILTWYVCKKNTKLNYHNTFGRPHQGSNIALELLGTAFPQG